MLIADPDLYFLPIPDPRVKKAPDPGSGTLDFKGHWTDLCLCLLPVGGEDLFVLGELGPHLGQGLLLLLQLTPEQVSHLVSLYLYAKF